ncbi:MAG TPA: hypothetical protein VM223_20915 [Planctomycetota bacterium]|nr:hypothetical protein [Planctomycetota bacterium]
MTRPQVGLDGVEALLDALADGRPVERGGIGGGAGMLEEIDVEAGRGILKLAAGAEHDMLVEALLLPVLKIKVEDAADGDDGVAGAFGCSSHSFVISAGLIRL